MNLYFYINECKNYVLRYKIAVIGLIILFLIGTMCGIIIAKPSNIFDYYFGYCDNYMYKIFSVGSSTLSIFTGRLLSNFLFLIAVCISCCIIFLFPLQVFTIFYKGFVFGTELTILCTCFSISGFFVSFLLVLPQSIIFGAILILSSPFSIECGLTTLRCLSLEKMKGYLPWLIFFAIFSVLSALLEFLTVVIIFRPFTFVL